MNNAKIIKDEWLLVWDGVLKHEVQIKYLKERIEKLEELLNNKQYNSNRW